MTKAQCWRAESYTDKILLAPMVRQFNLPFRLLFLEYAAYLLYTEELIYYKLGKCRRLKNKILKTIDHVDHHGDCVLRNDSIEKDRLLVQVGSDNFERFIEAARLVAHEVLELISILVAPRSSPSRVGWRPPCLKNPSR